MTKNSEARQIECSVEGITAQERTFKSKANGDKVTQRLYSRADGFALGAIRGGPLCIADEHTWEVFTMDNGIMIGESVGWITDAELQRSVRTLAAWGQDAA
jgi:hypothetical protein